PLVAWWSSHDSRKRPMALQDHEQFAAAETFDHTHTERRAGLEPQRFGKSFKGSLTARRSKTGNVMNSLILQLAAGAAVKQRVAKRHRFGLIQRFEDATRESGIQAGIQQPTFQKRESGHFGTHAETFDQRANGQLIKPHVGKIQTSGSRGA